LGDSEVFFWHETSATERLDRFGRRPPARTKRGQKAGWHRSTKKRSSAAPDRREIIGTDLLGDLDRLIDFRAEVAHDD